MLLQRARRHYEQRGFVVGDPPAGVRADLVVEKAGRRRLVRLDDDPLGTYQIGALAAEAKRARVQATVICPGSPEVIEACDQFGVEHLSLEGLGEEGPIIAPPAPVRPPSRPVVVDASAPTAVSTGPVTAAVPRWRWVVVAAVWLAAAVAWTWLLIRIF